MSDFARLRSNPHRGMFKVTARYKVQTMLGEIECVRLRGPFSPTTTALSVEHLSAELFQARFAVVRKKR